MKSTTTTIMAENNNDSDNTILNSTQANSKHWNYKYMGPSKRPSQLKNSRFEVLTQTSYSVTDLLWQHELACRTSEDRKMHGKQDQHARFL